MEEINLRNCPIAILSWIAASDGKVDSEERVLLEKISSKIGIEDTDFAVWAGKRGMGDRLSLFCSVVPHMSAEQKELLVILSINMCLADRYLKPSESLILLFLADLTGIGFKGLNRIFRDETGKDFPRLSDLSSSEWWIGKQKNTAGSKSGSSSKRMDALFVLRLSSESSESEIRAAYRRLASVHHPDRFSSLGPEAVELARKRFRRIKNAFDYLMRNQ